MGGGWRQLWQSTCRRPGIQYECGTVQREKTPDRPTPSRDEGGKRRGGDDEATRIEMEPARTKESAPIRRRMSKQGKASKQNQRNVWKWSVLLGHGSCN